MTTSETLTLRPRRNSTSVVISRPISAVPIRKKPTRSITASLLVGGERLKLARVRVGAVAVDEVVVAGRRCEDALGERGLQSRRALPRGAEAERGLGEGVGVERAGRADLRSDGLQQRDGVAVAHGRL